MKSSAIMASRSAQPGTLRLGFDVSLLDGDAVAEIADTVHRLSDGAVVVVEVRSEPARFVLAGPMSALELLRSIAPREGLGSSLGLEPGLPPSSGGASASTRVLLVDSDARRAERHAEILRRVDTEVWIVSGANAARSLLVDTELCFDALIVRHGLADGDGLAVLDSMASDERGCSVLVLDEQLLSERARSYRARGAFRYIASPREDLELIAEVRATVLDSYSWRQAAEPRGIRPGIPPRVCIDPGHAVERLRYLYRLTSVEREVAHCVLMGMRDADIAVRLKRSERTAKRHVGRILDKAGVCNRASLWAALYHDGREQSPARARVVKRVVELKPAANDPRAVQLAPTSEDPHGAEAMCSPMGGLSTPA